jgi:pimeloyl-ACP methyl ester carboxylesterase
VRLTQLLPDARIEVLDGTGAFPQVDQPHSVATQTRRFIAVTTPAAA